MIEKSIGDTYLVHEIKVEQMLLEAMTDAQLRGIIQRCRDEWKKRHRQKVCRCFAHSTSECGCGAWDEAP